MNFTREPIIESVISSNEGYKLRLSRLQGKEGQNEDYLVYALELVSYGTSYFYRHREKPKAFLLPVSEYELVQVKDTRLSLKYATVDKSIKITPEKNLRRSDARAPPSKEDVASKGEPKKGSKKVDRAKGDKKPQNNERTASSKSRHQASKPNAKDNTLQKEENLQKSAVRILAPPSSLISDSLKKYKSIDFSDKQNFSLLPPPDVMVDIPTVVLPADQSLTEPNTESKKGLEQNVKPLKEKTSATSSVSNDTLAAKSDAVNVEEKMLDKKEIKTQSKDSKEEIKGPQKE